MGKNIFTIFIQLICGSKPVNSIAHTYKTTKHSAELIYFYRLDNASLTTHFSIITLKENIQERELTIYMYNCNSSKSITSVSFHKNVAYTKHIYNRSSEQVMF